ncbi:N-acetylglucosamine-6-phosphate deacetylase-like [Convolutriloba macropyga]|uniref:N-acetylglucosamine-6-phosphate deacetylase-like n=1 Tax=Convolutriloba macropyga TaxID=536237 RepID=UPI003F5249D7
MSSTENIEQPITRFTNCKLCINGKTIEDDLWIRGDRIVDKQEVFYNDKQAPTTTIDCNGLYLAPGLIETQINGSIGLDFSDLSDPDTYLDKISRVREHLLQYGVTSFCPTIITSDAHTYELLDGLLSNVPLGAIEGVIGFHYEGPFLSDKFSGAHRKQLLRSATTVEAFTELYGSMKHVKMVTLAPERVSSTNDVIPKLVKKGITVSIGHSDCTYEEAMEAIKQGANSITHLYSCMRVMHHREPGIIGTISSDERLYYGVITDGVHISSPVIRSTYKINPKGMILVTDASSTAGFEPGVYVSNGQKVQVMEDRVIIHGTNTLAGSTANLVQCLQFLKDSSDLTVAEAIKCASENVANMLGETDIGTLAPGKTANLLVLTENFQPVIVIYKGRVVFKNGSL